MNERITIPENTRVIIDGDVIIFESKEPEKHKLNKWYHSDTWIGLTIRSEDEEDNSFYCNGFMKVGNNWKWFENMCCILDGCQPADMSTVTRLLIGEAEKRGLTGKGKVKSPCGKHENRIRKHGKNLFINAFGSLCIGDKYHREGIILFESKTGLWAEIIPEKKPLYTNCYDREYFGEESEYSFLRNDGTAIYPSHVFFKDSSFARGVSNSVIFYGTERECHQYLADNWDELNK